MSQQSPRYSPPKTRPCLSQSSVQPSQEDMPNDYRGMDAAFQIAKLCLTKRSTTAPEMTMKTAIVAMLLMAWGSAALADWVEDTALQRQQYENRRIEAEKYLAFERAQRDLTGRNSGTEFRIQRACTYALESGVENDVRRSYGCKDL